eukprot:jgi/Mesen1/676/ME000109S10895
MDLLQKAFSRRCCQWPAVGGGRGSPGRALGSKSLGGTLAPAICSLPWLTSIDLSQNQLSGAIPACLGNQPSLTHVALGGNGFSGALPQGLCRAKKLTRLDLSGNGLSGLIPSCLGQLTALTALNLGSNRFSGSVTSQLCLLKKLTSLHLGSNQLSGSVPSCLPALLRLRELNLSGNYLTGSSCPPKSNSTSNCFSVPKCAQAQRSAEECASFCGGASLAYGPCGARGRCFLSGIQPTCACQPGYKSTREAGVASCTRPSACSAPPPPSKQSPPPPASEPPPSPGPPPAPSPPGSFEFPPVELPPEKPPSQSPPVSSGPSSPHARGLIPPLGGQPVKYLNKYFRHASYGFAGDANTSVWNPQQLYVDWRQQGVLPPIKEQGRCESSWAFAAVGAIEAATAIVTSRQVVASEQQVIDCQRGGSTCTGGWPSNAFEYAAENTAKCYGGLASESDYPYTGIRSKKGCNLIAADRGQLGVGAWEQADFHGVLGLLLAVQRQPVVVHLEADQDSFTNYTGNFRVGLMLD